LCERTTHIFPVLDYSSTFSKITHEVYRALDVQVMPLCRTSYKTGIERRRPARAVSKYRDSYGRERPEDEGLRPERGLEPRGNFLQPSTVLPIVVGLVVASTLGELSYSTLKGNILPDEPCVCVARVKNGLETVIAGITSYHPQGW
jgi:hypothetical protein